MDGEANAEGDGGSHITWIGAFHGERTVHSAVVGERVVHAVFAPSEDRVRHRESGCRHLLWGVGVQRHSVRQRFLGDGECPVGLGKRLPVVVPYGDAVGDRQGTEEGGVVRPSCHGQVTAGASVRIGVYPVHEIVDVPPCSGEVGAQRRVHDVGAVGERRMIEGQVLDRCGVFLSVQVVRYRPTRIHLR